MGLGRLCHFFLEIAKSKSPHQGIFIYVLYDYWGQCLSEFSYVVSSSLIWIGVPFLTGVNRYLQIIIINKSRKTGIAFGN